MNATIRHRGPDDEGTVSCGGFTLGSCRLKVIDLSSAGHQPLATEEGDCWIVFNGEIYNYRRLRSELEALGRSFFSASDTEVILQAYKEWGSRFLSRLEGIWAFAILDSTRGELILSRDRLGVKPLYFLADGDTFAFSSELKTFTVAPLRRPIDGAGLRELLALGFNPTRRTCLKDVWKLRAGELLRYSIADGSWRIDRYWSRAGPLGVGSARVDQVGRVVQDAVESNLVSDVPVGCYLSGGVDSSLVTLLYAGAYPGRLHTYTVGFEEGADERPHARVVADLVGSGYHELSLPQESVARDFDRILYSYDLSLTDPAFVPNFYLARRAKQDVTVVLAGEGGDELFGGYDYYRALRLTEATGLAWVADGAHRLVTRNGGFGRWSDAAAKTLGTLGHVNGDAAYVLDLYSPLPLGKIQRLVPGYDPAEVTRQIVLEAEREGIPSHVAPFLLYDQMFLLAEKFNAKADKASSAFSIEE
ncbi:MAG TPA: asparagine synthase (glutamine-hydrolyzing), partial [Thermoplasmata archaeon]|nr:asparagine synthase (glutamine-hydrolyzing) [Thermoplasmata archaeon]